MVGGTERSSPKMWSLACGGKIKHIFQQKNTWQIDMHIWSHLKIALGFCWCHLLFLDIFGTCVLLPLLFFFSWARHPRYTVDPLLDLDPNGISARDTSGNDGKMGWLILCSPYWITMLSYIIHILSWIIQSIYYIEYCEKIEDVSVGNTMKQPTVPSWFPASSCPGRSKTSSIGTDLWSNVVDVVVIFTGWVAGKWSQYPRSMIYHDL